MDEDLVYDIIRNNNPQLPEHQIQEITQGVLSNDPAYSSYAGDVLTHMSNYGASSQPFMSLPSQVTGPSHYTKAIYGGFDPDAYERDAKASGRVKLPNNSAKLRSYRLADLAIADNPDIRQNIENYGRGDAENDAKVVQAMQLAEKMRLNDYYESSGNTDLIQPYSMEENAQALGNVVSNYTRGIRTQAPVVYNQAVNKAKQYGNAAVDTAKQYGNTAINKAQQYGNAAVDTARQYGSKAVDATQYYGNQAINKAQQYGNAAVDKAREYGDEFVNYADSIPAEPSRIHDAARSYRFLAHDPESAVEGAKMMASDAADYTQKNAPRWVANVSSKLNQGSNFFKSLGDAWEDPEHYMQGGTYEDKLRDRKARAIHMENPDMQPKVPVQSSTPNQEGGFRASSNQAVTPPTTQPTKPAVRR